MRDLLHWRQDPPQHPRKAENAFPIGPIRWHEKPTGDLEAYAVGTKDGKLRKEYIATLPSEAAQVGTGSALKELQKTSTHDHDLFHTPMATTGIHTHPTNGGDYFPGAGNTPEEVSEPASRAETPLALGAQSQPIPNNQANVPETSKATGQVDRASDPQTNAVHKQSASASESLPPPPPPKSSTGRRDMSPSAAGLAIPTASRNGRTSETRSSASPSRSALAEVTDSLPAEFSGPIDKTRDTTSPTGSGRQALGTTSTAVGGYESMMSRKHSSSSSGFSSAFRGGAAAFAGKGSTAWKGGTAAVAGAGGGAKEWSSKFRSRFSSMGSKRRGSKDMGDGKSETGDKTPVQRPQRRVVPVSETF